MYLIIRLLFLCFMLVGCVQQHRSDSCALSSQEQMLYVEQLQGRNACLRQLKTHAVQVIKLGDELKFHIALDRILIPNSANLRSDTSDVLGPFICLLRHKLNYGVRVIVHNHCCLSTHSLNLSLSDQQALVIADYFARRGLDARVIYSHGVNNLSRCFKPYVEITTRLMQLEDVE